jgi:hypothetical protein
MSAPTDTISRAPERCAACQQEFFPQNGADWFCSDECYEAYQDTTPGERALVDPMEFL